MSSSLNKEKKDRTIINSKASKQSRANKNRKRNSPFCVSAVFLAAVLLITVPTAAWGAGKIVFSENTTQEADTTQEAVSGKVPEEPVLEPSVQRLEDLPRDPVEDWAREAAAGKKEAAAQPSAEDEITVHLASEPGAPIPFEVMDTDTASLLKQISEGLVTLDENGEAAPGCAKKWSVSDHGLKWKFTLRRDLSWSDGEPITAGDFADLFKKIADPSEEILYGQDLTKNIAGYEKVLEGDPGALEVSAKDDRTLVIRLSSPDPAFARKCASWTLLPIRELMAFHGRDNNTSSDSETDDSDLHSENESENKSEDELENKTENRLKNESENRKLTWDTVTGNGPYVIESCIPGQEYILTRNPYYRQDQYRQDRKDSSTVRTAGANVLQDNELFTTVKWKVSGDVNQEYSDFLNGNIDAISQLPEETLSSGEAAGYYSEQTVPDMLGMLFNCNHEALQDARVRQALSIAADRRHISADILGGVYLPADDFTDILKDSSVSFDDRNLLSERDSTAKDSSERDSTERDSTERDSTEKDSTAKDSSERDSSKKDSNAKDSSEIDSSADKKKSLEKAAKLLREAGYRAGLQNPETAEGLQTPDHSEEAENKEGTKDAEESKEVKDFPALTCMAQENSPASEIAQYLAAEWNKLGIVVNVKTADAKHIAKAKEKGKYDILCGNLFIASDLPSTEIERFASESSENSCGYESKDFDKKLEKAQSASGEKNYSDRLQDAAGILTKETPASPLAMRTVSWLHDPSKADISCDAAGCWLIRKNQTQENQIQDNRTQETRIRENQTQESGHEEVNEDVYEDIYEDGQESRKRDEIEGRQEDEQNTWMTRLKQSVMYFDRADCTAYLTRQAYVLDAADKDAGRLVSLPKYTPVHLTGTGNAGYVRIEMDGIIRFMESGSVTADAATMQEIRTLENLQADRGEFLTKPVHLVKEIELSRRAEGVHEETDRILAEIAFQEMLRTQTRNPNWNGPVLSRGNGSVRGPSGKETYYNLNMNGVVNIMRRMGNTDEYWVRDDGCKMLGNYIMCAANLGVHPRGSLVESSLGTCIVCDTGGFARGNSQQLDIAVTW